MEEGKGVKIAAEANRSTALSSEMDGFPLAGLSLVKMSSERYDCVVWLR